MQGNHASDHPKSANMVDHNVNTVATQESFRLMDLPTELRLMIYKRIPREIKQVPLATMGKKGPIVFLQPMTSTSILAVSKKVHAEAAPIVFETLRNFILTKTPKIIAGLVSHQRLNLMKFFIHLLAEQYLAEKNGTQPNQGTIQNHLSRVCHALWGPSHAQHSEETLQWDMPKMVSFAAFSVRQLTYQYNETMNQADQQSNHKVSSVEIVPQDYFKLELLYGYRKDFRKSFPDNYSPADVIAEYLGALEYFYLSNLNCKVDVVLVGQIPIPKDEEIPREIPYDILEVPKLPREFPNVHRTAKTGAVAFPELMGRKTWTAEWPAAGDRPDDQVVDYEALAALNLGDT
jgi:hypothetical protein